MLRNKIIIKRNEGKNTWSPPARTWSRITRKGNETLPVLIMNNSRSSHPLCRTRPKSRCALSSLEHKTTTRVIRIQNIIAGEGGRKCKVCFYSAWSTNKSTCTRIENARCAFIRSGTQTKTRLQNVITGEGGSATSSALAPNQDYVCTVGGRRFFSGLGPLARSTILLVCSVYYSFRWGVFLSDKRRSSSCTFVGESKRKNNNIFSCLDTYARSRRNGLQNAAARKENGTFVLFFW